MIIQECSAVSFCEEEDFLLETIRGMLKGGDDMGLSVALVNIVYCCM